MANAEELNRKGMEQYKAGMLDEAIATWEEAVAVKPDYAPGFINLTLAFLKKSRPDDAVRAAEKAAAIAPHHGACHYTLGNAYSAKGRWNEAVTSYTRAFELDKKQWNALAQAGSLLLDRGLEAKAMDYWKKFLEAAPPDHPKRAEIQAEVTEWENRKPIIRKF